MDFDDARAGFKCEIAVDAGFLLDKSGKAARTIAAHFTDAAVVVVEIPGPIRFAGTRWDKNNRTVSAHAPMAVTQTNDLVAGELDGLCSIINQHKIISRTVHFGEFQNH